MDKYFSCKFISFDNELLRYGDENMLTCDRVIEHYLHHNVNNESTEEDIYNIVNSLGLFKETRIPIEKDLIFIKLRRVV